jgi:hypothetical protein
MTLESPLALQLLLHCYARVEAHPDAENPIQKKILSDFSAHGITYRDDIHQCDRTTDLGDAWVALILQTPPPTKAFLDQHGNIIK